MSGLIEQAINGDKHALRLLFENIQSGISALNVTAGIVGANTDSASPINPVPAPAVLRVSPSTSGFHAVSITNPQFVRSSVPAQKRGNLARSPLTHVLSYSTDANFKSDVTTLPPGTQTHYQIPGAGKGLYFRIQSSVDGVNFNLPQQHGPVSS